MFFEKELNIKILNPNEALLGTLHPHYVEIVETNELKGIRTLQITHPLFDDYNNDLTHYNDLLKMGNKIWREKTGDGDSCLYVLLDNKQIDPNTNLLNISAEEITVELSMVPPIRFHNLHDQKITQKWLQSIYGNHYTPRIVQEDKTFSYNGVIGLLGLIKKIEEQTGYEFQFRYEYNPKLDIIHRYMDFTEKKGKIINTPIKIGYNTDNIVSEETESDVAIAAAPIGAPRNTKDEAKEFHKAQKNFENLQVTIGQQIHWYTSKDEKGKVILGPLKTAPYSKISGQNYVLSPVTGSGALYKEVYQKEKSVNKIPRTILFESNEEDPINLYWRCVEKIDEKKQPQFKITADIIDIHHIKNQKPTYFNAGDTVLVQLPGRYDRVTARVTKTTKNPREFEKDKIELGNYQLNFFADYIQNPYPRVEPYTIHSQTVPPATPDIPGSKGENWDEWVVPTEENTPPENMIETGEEITVEGEMHGESFQQTPPATLNWLEELKQIPLPGIKENYDQITPIVIPSKSTLVLVKKTHNFVARLFVKVNLNIYKTIESTLPWFEEKLESFDLWIESRLMAMYRFILKLVFGIIILLIILGMFIRWRNHGAVAVLIAQNHGGGGPPGIPPRPPGNMFNQGPQNPRIININIPAIPPHPYYPSDQVIPLGTILDRVQQNIRANNNSFDVTTNTNPFEYPFEVITNTNPFEDPSYSYYPLVPRRGGVNQFLNQIVLQRIRSWRIQIQFTDGYSFVNISARIKLQGQTIHIFARIPTQTARIIWRILQIWIYHLHQSRIAWRSNLDLDSITPNTILTILDNVRRLSLPSPSNILNVLDEVRMSSLPSPNNILTVLKDIPKLEEEQEAVTNENELNIAPHTITNEESPNPIQRNLISEKIRQLELEQELRQKNINESLDITYIMFNANRLEEIKKEIEKLEKKLEKK